MKSKITNKRKNKSRTGAVEIFSEGMQSFGKFLIFAIVSLVIFAIIVPVSGGRGIPYFALGYLLAYYFLFAKKSTAIVKLSIVVSSLIMVAVAVSLLGK